MAVDAVVYFRISNATVSVTNVEDAHHSTRLLAQTTLRNILGTKTLAEILADREHIASTMQTNLDGATDPWGVKGVFECIVAVGLQSSASRSRTCVCRRTCSAPWPPRPTW